MIAKRAEEDPDFPAMVDAAAAARAERGAKLKATLEPQTRERPTSSMRSSSPGRERGSDAGSQS